MSPSSEHEYGELSTDSIDSMVEIKTNNSTTTPKSTHVLDTENDLEGSRYRLLYSKSKVYVNPTVYARDNIPGFVALVKREAVNPTFLLAWLPEKLLNEKGQTEWDKFVKTEEKNADNDEEDEDAVLIDLPIPRPETYAFSVPLTSIYSLIIQPPSLSSWHGSITINLINGTSLPTLHFHDDESLSFTLPSRPSTSAPNPIPDKPIHNHSSYPPPQLPPQHHKGTSWGGEDLLNRLRHHSYLLRSNLQPTLFLVDPSREDIEAHSMQVFDDDAVDDIMAQSSYSGSFSPIPAHRRPQPISTSTSGSSQTQPSTPVNPYSPRSSVLHRSLHPPPSYSPSSSTNPSQARLALLQSFSQITRHAAHAAQTILSHPLAKPIIPHLPDPVKSLVSARGDLEWQSSRDASVVEKGGVGEFESARVYLARWARVVAEEGERARRREAHALPSSSTTELPAESGELGIFEILQSNATANLPTPKSSRDPQHPIDEEEWDSWFEKNGRPKVNEGGMRREVFRRGFKSNSVRRRSWPFLLGVWDWDTTQEERERKWNAKKNTYKKLKAEWWGVPEVFERNDVIEERHRIDVDCRRTDRNQPMFATSTPPSLDVEEIDDENAKKSEGRKSPSRRDEKERAMRYSTISPGLSDIGAQAPTNEHIERMGGILLTYNFYEKELGYVQGMSDLCAPVYIVMAADEELTFWCFVEIMNKMKQNFLRDQSGMKRQLSTLQQLISLMDPELYRHLEKTDSLNLFFCFRWILIAFKREFPFEDVLRIWEVLWTDYYSQAQGFVLFVALAVLESHRDVILRYLAEFDEILKYCNELSMTIELDTTLAQAEVLFLSYSQLVADLDRRRAEQASDPSSLSATELRKRKGGANENTNGSPDQAVKLKIPELSEELRDLLKTDR